MLFGPSGSGKTTVLRTIAGFVRPDAGRIARARSCVVRLSEPGYLCPAHQRPVRSAGQSSAAVSASQPSLEHRCMEADGVQSPQMRVRSSRRSLRLFRLTAMADRMPRELSGGERQRGSVARAVVSAVTYEGPASRFCCSMSRSPDWTTPCGMNCCRSCRRGCCNGRFRCFRSRMMWARPFNSAPRSSNRRGRVVRQGPVSEVLAEERLRLMEQLRLEQLNRSN